MQLALGTVQFGLKYGVAGRGSTVPEVEVKAILTRAAELGIHVLDTASAYGDIEGRLATLAGKSQFQVISKISPKPPDLNELALHAWVTAEILRSCDRLGTALYGLMFHRAEDLLEDNGDVLWAACEAVAADRNLKLGVSCYDIKTLQKVQSLFPVAIAQVPGNAFDQRLELTALPAAPLSEIHVRSAFLQGLLLMPEPQAAARIPAAANALRHWWAWCDSHHMAPMTAALGVVKGFAGASHCVVGVDNLMQLEQLAQAWADAPVLVAPELAVSGTTVIDPRRWPVEGS